MAFKKGETYYNLPNLAIRIPEIPFFASHEVVTKPVAFKVHDKTSIGYQQT
jgi:hypothetical protein